MRYNTVKASTRSGTPSSTRAGPQLRDSRVNSADSMTAMKKRREEEEWVDVETMARMRWKSQWMMIMMMLVKMEVGTRICPSQVCLWVS